MLSKGRESKLSSRSRLTIALFAEITETARNENFLHRAVILRVYARGARARAYRMDEPFSLGKLDLQSSLIVKATALASEPVRNDLTGAPVKMTDAPYALTVTRFKIISVLKGKLAPGDEINFRHYAFILPFQGSWTYSVKNYNFSVGRSYFLWANRDSDNWQPFSPYDSSFSDQGALLTADDAPIKGQIRDVVWNQIQGLLASQKIGDGTTGLRYLSFMRRRNAGVFAETTGDFTNDEVAEALRPFIGASNPFVAVAAISAAQFDAPRFAAELLSASQSPEPNVRAAAIVALSKVVTPDSEAGIRAGVNSSSSGVAAAALRALAAFPGDAARATWKRWAKSDDPARRRAVADAIADAHDEAMLPILKALTHDADSSVRYAASSALSRYQYPGLGF